MDQVNSGSTKAKAIFDDAVLYPNPYMVVTPKGYTKHYYAGTERMATVIGGGGLGDMTPVMDRLNLRHDWEIIDAFYKQYQTNDPFLYEKLLSGPENTEDIDHKQNPELDYQCKPVYLDYVDVLTKTDILFEAIDKNTQINSKEGEVYFYHGDHLGSANWITDIKGDAIQYMHYAPYGELIDNQQASGSWYDERYKFTGKERDWETGYDYFGARYWWLGGTWLSVDPLASDYPQITPYAYGLWNPIKYIDPDGRKIVVGTWYGRVLAKLGMNNFEAKTTQRLQDLKSVSPELSKAIKSMETNKKVKVNIQPMSKYEGEPNEGVTVRDGNNSDVYYNEDVGFMIDGNFSSPDAILAHELGHAENNMNGTYIVYDHNEAKKSNGSITEKRNGNANEKKSIYYENQVRQKEGEPARSYDYYKANKESNQ